MNRMSKARVRAAVARALWSSVLFAYLLLLGFHWLAAMVGGFGVVDWWLVFVEWKVSKLSERR